jgi:DNA replication and repair protein RecF
MRIVSVQLRDFRTYARAAAQLGPGLTVVHGPNGAGKSNLLEAVYYGCAGRSPRTRNDRELISFGAAATRVVVRFADGDGEHELAAGFAAQSSGERAAKRMTFDGAPVERLLDLPDRPLLSVFMPERLELIKGPPSLRRAHLDQVVAALWPARAEIRRDYARALAQRNALIAAIRSGRSSAATLPSWDRELAVHGIALREVRSRAVELLAGPFSARAEQLGSSGEITLEYRPRTRANSEDELVAELQQRMTGDLERGFTGHGPHRDELAFVRDGRDLRVYGSQGEQRLAVLALLLAERAVLARERRRTPVLLLDDVMSELDRDRRRALVELLRSAGGQSVITATDLDQVPGADEPGVVRLAVAEGQIFAEAIAV